MDYKIVLPMPGLLRILNDLKSRFTDAAHSRVQSRYLIYKGD